MRKFRWNSEKNVFLENERNITFEEVVYRISEGALIAEVEHPNKEKFPNQKVLVVDVDYYAYLVPYVVDEDGCLFLKTIIPSRKATKAYLRG